MNPQEINKRIAIACGWTHVRDAHGDLNAMNEAEQILTDDQRSEMINALCEIVLRDRNTEAGPMTAITAAFFAPAAQLAEAFLRTIGQWEDKE